MSMTEHHEVVVLGGGCAGLAAAAALAEKGVDVALLEARSRLGGRVWTLHADGEPIELGAEFVHGEAPRTVAIARQGDVAFEEVRSAQRWLRGGTLVEAPDLTRSLHAAVEATARVDRREPDRSFAEALAAARVDDPGRALALEYVQDRKSVV